MKSYRNTITRTMVLFVLAALVVLMTHAAAQAQTGDSTAPVVTSVTPANGATVYTNGATTVTTISATYEDEVDGSGVDPATVMVHLDGTNMLYNCPTQTETSVSCLAMVSDLSPGTHPLDIYVGDYAGNMRMSRSYLTVVVDDQPPVYTNLMPVDGSIIYTSLLTSSVMVTLDYSDPSPSGGNIKPMVHINDLHDGTSGAMIMGCTKTATSYSCQLNKAKRLRLGVNQVEVLMSDGVGNNNYALPSRLNYYTVVDDVAPSVTGLNPDATSIDAVFSDPAPVGAMSTSLTSGVNPASATVQIDGNILAGCAATETGVNCSTPSGLSPGDHTVTVSVDDNAGNQGTVTGTLTVDPPPCAPGRPALTLSKQSVEWGSMADYQARELSVQLMLTNNGAEVADNIAVLTGFSNVSGITLSTTMPVELGPLAGGDSASTIIKFHVPDGIGSFRVSFTARAMDACGTGYGYPSDVAAGMTTNT